MDTKADAHITIAGRDFELILTTRATRLIAERYGGLDKLGAALETSTDIAQSLTEVTWLIALLANQSVLIHNLTNPQDPKPEITAEDLEILTVPGDLAGYKEAISAALVKGTKREILSDPKAATPKP